MRWATELMDLAMRLAMIRGAASDRRKSKHVQSLPHSRCFSIDGDGLSAYPQLLEDLDLVSQLVQDLHDDLSSVEETAARQGHALDQLSAAMQALDSHGGGDQSRDQVVADLEIVFEQLRNAEDELTCCSETVTLHGFKLQHLDLAMQVLTEIFVEVVVGGGTHLLANSRLQRLRLACGQALCGTTAPFEIEVALQAVAH